MLLTVASDASCPHPVQPHRMLLTITLLSRGAGHVIDQGLARAWPGSVLLGGLLACRGDTPSGSFVGAVAGAVHEDLVAVVDDPVEEGFGDDGIGEQRVPVLGGPVRGEHEGSAASFGAEPAEVVGSGA